MTSHSLSCLVFFILLLQNLTTQFRKAVARLMARAATTLKLSRSWCKIEVIALFSLSFLFLLDLLISTVYLPSISLSNRPQCPPRIRIIRWWRSNPRAETRGELVSGPYITFLQYPPTDLFRLHRYPIHLLPPLRPFCLWGRRPYPVQVQAVLLPPPLVHP